MNPTLDRWNHADEEAALHAVLACCGARRWARAMVALRPFQSFAEMTEAADRVWAEMGEKDWMEAFACHPRIGERKAVHASARSVAWSRDEQSSTEEANESVMSEIATGNVKYEEQFGFSFIVCATGKSAEEMLISLNSRLGNDRATELREAAEQQRQITQIRLRKWVTG
jgi:2-oxo-4-hydroxy-4-carboxy-5-ureidoimidazoline decarboxylase